MFFEDIQESSNYLSKKVGVSEFENDYYLKEHAILGKSDWNEFVYSLKYKNRYCCKIVNEKPLEILLRSFTRIITKDSIFYRSRICKDTKGYMGKEMSAPPPGVSTEGRVNSFGISRLYLADSEETAIHEVRASELDYVCVGEFKIKKTLNIIDLRQIEICSLCALSERLNPVDILINKEILINLDNEMSHGLRRDDSKLDYIPTQYIADFIEAMDNIDGIIYKSTMNFEGYNLTLFNSENACLIKNPVVYKISNVVYSKERVQ